MIKALYVSFKNWRSSRDAITELHRLTDRELDDIGLSRGEIEAAVKTGIRI
ncbi:MULTISPECIES: DUF1127 domain-containing protein [Lichenihabitans]|nr:MULTISPECIES: DUF1127 domain-containing protein [Lichenihabitans]UDL94165.1 DUF1127 domain-containing protein [Lichenihabitans sp. PAMC28606]